MATTETTISVTDDSVNIKANSDVENDIVGLCRTKTNIIISDDSGEDDGDNHHVEIEFKRKAVSDSKEMIGSKGSGVRNKVVDCSDKEIYSNDGNEADSEGDVISLYSSGNTLPATMGDSREETGQKTYQNSKRFSRILDSDSEDEKVFSLLFNKKNHSCDEFQDNRSSSPGSDCLIKKTGDEKARPVRRPTKVVNSESENEDLIMDQGETSMPKKPKDIETSPKSMMNSVNKTDNNTHVSKPNKISALIDTDSEEDHLATHKFGGSSDEGQPIKKPNTVRQKGNAEKKKRFGSIRAAKEEAMREIHSESQRILRESQVCLPYHRPRQRTLQEFLNRRKDLPTLPTTLTTAIKMKMSGEIVGKVLEEKEKEAELFYKSSSESDNEGGTQTGFAIANIKHKPTVVENNIENMLMIEETQKIIRNDLKHSQDVKEVIQQGDKNLGVPRKLFDSSVNATEAPLLIEDNDFDEFTEKNQDCKQRCKEFKQGLKAVSIPRKLFGSECVEPMEIHHEQINTSDDNIDEIQEICEPNDSQMKVSNKSDQFLETEIIDRLVKNSKIQTNQTMEGEAEDFELRMSEDLYELTNDQTVVHDIAIPKTSVVEFEVITETPLINNRELSKLNETEKTDSGIITADENLTSDDWIKPKDIHLSSVGNEESLSSINESSCNDEVSEDQNKAIGHVYGLPLPDFDDNKPNRRKTRILPEIMRLTPKLRGSPDTMIELSRPKGGINQLIKRFLDHSVAKKTPESGQKITTIRTEQTTSGLKTINEVLPYKIPINEKNDDPELSKPGAKLVRLKEDLQQQMAIQRSKEWKQKELEMKEMEADEVYCDERSDCGIEEENDIAEEEGEEEDGEKLSDDGESEPDEDDMPIKEAKHKYKSPFVDIEAEVSGEESDEEEEKGVRDKEDGKDAASHHSFDDDKKYEVNEASETATSQRNQTRKLKRIVKAFEDDDSNEVKETDLNASDVNNGHHFRRTKTDVDMFATDNNSNDAWSSGTEGDLPVYQQRINETSQSCATSSVVNNSLSIVSPITQLTALNTGSESVHTDLRTAQNLQLIARLSVETTPIELKCYRECDSEKREKLQKKLFHDIKETPNDTELMDLCSGEFSDNASGIAELDRLMHTAKKTDVSDQELLDLCSGTFDTQPPDIKNLEARREKVPDVLVPSSNSFLPLPNKLSKEQSQKADTIPSTFKIVFSSDDEDETHNSQVKNARGKKLKKKVRKLKLSDDEEESDNASLLDIDEEEDSEEKCVEYDSEENEIVDRKKNIRKAAARFFEEEAELSESEWGSADEDERDLDKLDWEEGDLEDIDQDQVKKQLEKIHMRQVLDEDQREVRLLQEILLEDGELHSDKASRQRKFKWKNIDELGEGDESRLQSVDEEGVSTYQNEAESELEWRKQRLEREQFLKEQRIKETAADDEEEMEDSQLFKLGMRALKKNKNIKNPNIDVSQSIVDDQSHTSTTRHTVADLFASPGSGKNTFALKRAIHRGSFLARGEESLARLSVITKQNSNTAIIRTKRPRNFVFAHLSPAIEAPVESDELDDHGNTETMGAKLRKRKPASSLTPVAPKRSKKEYQESNAKNKLFH